MSRVSQVSATGATADGGHAELRVEADRSKCMGAGMCALNAPEVFDQDEDAGTRCGTR